MELVRHHMTRNAIYIYGIYETSDDQLCQSDATLEKSISK